MDFYSYARRSQNRERSDRVLELRNSEFGSAIQSPVRNGKAKDCLDEVRKEMNRAAQDAPELSTRFWQREAKRFGVRERLHSH